MPAKPTSAVKIIVGGVELATNQLLEVKVRDNLLLPDTAVVRMRDPKAAEVATTFTIGDPLEIRLGAADENTLQTVFKGELVALEPEFSERACVVAARAYDRGWRLNRQRKSRTFQSQTAEDMVRTVAAESHLTAGEVESTGAVHEFFQQSMETDWEFCWRLASMYDREFLVDDQRFHFRKRTKSSPAVTLTWGETGSLLAFKPRMSGIGQVTEVTVANHDPKVAQALVGRARSPQVAGASDAHDGRAAVVGQLAAGAVVVADRVVTTQSEADKVAQSMLDRLSSSFVEADGKAHGDPRIRAGATIRIDNVAQFSGEYVLTQTTHTYGSGHGYTTGFVISGRTSHSFAELLRRDTRRDWASSLVMGVVTNNNDPDQMGRVRVKFPALGDSIEGWWARVATVNAGSERGLYMLPQPGDEVVVAFEHGDTRRPLVLGSLYNGRDKVPVELRDAASRKAAFGVKSDNVVHVEGKQAMTLRTGEKLTIEVNRNGQGGTGNALLDAKGNIEEKAAQAVKVSAGTTIELTANQSVTIKGTAGVTVETTGPLKLKGAMVDIEATGIVNVKGSVINLG